MTTRKRKQKRSTTKKKGRKRKAVKKPVHKHVVRRKKVVRRKRITKPKTITKHDTGISNKDPEEKKNEIRQHQYVEHKPTEDELLLNVRKYKTKIERIKNEVKKGIIGQDNVIDSVLKCLVAGGHVLLESVPGLAKTFLTMLINETMEGSIFNRIQFTPDLLPADITGVTIYDKVKGFYVMKGPIFANLLLADELNRTPPKVQSAMLQAMQENQVTIGRKTYDLPKPFFVMATQNPLEQRGVYPLSAAQVDRFLFKIYVDYPDEDNEFYVMDQNSNMKAISEYGIEKVITPYEILEMQNTVKYIHLSSELKEYIVNIVDATRHPENYGLAEEAKYIQFGGSPRASINIGLSAKATALLNGRVFVTPEDVRSVTKEVLRHRIILNYEGKAREINTDDIIDEIMKKVPVL
ncbi:MAG: MoxR family ATPase [Candidatus Micrarchaeota archaeon]|nr:MoxR family ATPase [Candidatus Micrarchaeota archaeon]